MSKQALRRLVFLKHKLIADLEAGDKMFVYRLTERNLDPAELDRLHRAVRSYGDNMLLYVRYEDAQHPNGTVELAAPGLMIGYIDRFKMAPDGQLSATPPSASWLEICKNAHRVFQESMGSEIPLPTTAPREQAIMAHPQERMTGRSSAGTRPGALALRRDDPRTVGILDKIGILAGTDKSCLEHGYLTHYAEIFDPLRSCSFNLIEIGVAGGSSLKMWEEYFPHATVVGIDINPDCARHAGGRRIVEIGSQADVEFLRSVAGRYPPAIVIDDGSHQPNHIQTAFKTLYPLVEPGGFYAVEDIMNYSSRTSDLNADEAFVDSPAYFMRLALACMLDHLSPGEQNATTALVKQTTHRVTFVRRAVILEKKQHQSAIISKIPELASLAEESKSVWNWIYLSNFILRNEGPVEEAERAARRAIDISPAGPWQFFRLSEALERKGDVAGAIEAMQRVVECAPQDANWAARLNRLLERQRTE